MPGATELVKPETAMDRSRRPREVIADAKDKAEAVREIIDRCKLARKIGGGEHVEYEGWSTVARFYECIPTVEWTKEIRDGEGKFIGYHARAAVRHIPSLSVLCGAEAICTREEPNWAQKIPSAIESMAQTRAASKVCRLAFSWVMVLAGFKPTPAEEMEETVHGRRSPPVGQPKRRVPPEEDDSTAPPVRPPRGPMVSKEDAEEIRTALTIDGARNLTELRVFLSGRLGYPRNVNADEIAQEDFETIISWLAGNDVIEKVNARNART